jgi:hypothetical protein
VYREEFALSIVKPHRVVSSAGSILFTLRLLWVTIFVNVRTRYKQHKYGISVTAGTRNRYIITNNRGKSLETGIVSDNSTGATKTVSGNI